MSTFRHMMKDTVWATYVISEGGRDDRGNPLPPVWAEPFPVRCRKEDKQQLVRHKSGAEVVAKTLIITDVPIETHWRFWLEGEPSLPPGPQALEPLAVGSAPSLDGRTRLWEAHFG